MWNPFKKEGVNDDAATKDLNEFIDKIGTSFEAKLEDKLKPIRDEVNTVKTRWDALEKAAAEGDGGGGGNGGGGGEEQNLTDDQKRAVENQKLLALSIATNARVTEGEILGEVVGQGLGEFIPKIKEYFEKTPLARKGQADYSTYCRNIVDMVVGAAARSGGLKFNGQNKKFFLEDASANNGGPEYEFLAGDMTWTDPHTGKVYSATDQLAKLGIKPEEFAESIKRGAV